MLVWVSDWQIACCGDTFKVGGPVAWTLDTSEDQDWFIGVLGHDLAAQVDASEEHHGGLPEDTPVTKATVQRIRAVSSRFGPSSQGGNVLVPIPGTTELVDVPEADGFFPAPDGLHFNGYLVDVLEA
jgi:hypothetical protein